MEITWILNGTSIMNSSIVTISEEEFTRGEMVFKQSFLELCSLSTSDTGVYSCSVSNGVTIVNDTTRLSLNVPGLLISACQNSDPFQENGPQLGRNQFSCFT